MSIIAPAELTAVRPEVRATRALNVELLGLGAASVVVLFGLLLGYSARMGRIDEVQPATPVIRLDDLRAPADLESALTMFVSPAERTAVASAIYKRAVGPPRLEHVGGLAAVRIPADEIRRDERYVQLRERLERRPNAQEVAALTPTDIVAVKPGMTVRTRGEYGFRFWRAVAWLFAVFWFAHLMRRWRRRDDDPVLVPCLMLLCGIGAMTMAAARDPLRDTMSIVVFSQGTAVGILLLLLISEFDFEASRLRRAIVSPLAIAIALAILLLLFGSGPGASGVKVNLFGVQPVEAIRLLVVFSLAAYFGRRIELLRGLSEAPTAERPWLRFVRLPRWTDVRPVLTSMALVLGFFFLQKDLGPALVLTCVFLAMYGIGRGHVAFVVTGFVLLFAGFALAYWIGFPATVRHRVMIWSDPWNNGVPGGNHIAHGLWALSTGAVWGSGPGLGSPHTIPAGHTDFVLAALGEELGFVGVTAVVLLYGLLGWRCLRSASRAPGDYSAFLAVGVALVLLVQALVIGAGLLGVIPLSGVVTPFLSFGRSSMLANCVAVGVVLAIAKRRSKVRLHLRRPIRVLGLVVTAAVLVLASRAAWVQVVHADDFAATPVLTEQADGGYRFEHNPRLLSAARTLERGTIYDRNGLPLATSRPEEIASLAATYRAAGIAPSQECRDNERCYPLGGFAFHLVGNWNQQTNWGARNSSYLERDSDARLRGYDDHARLIEVVNPRSGRREQAITRNLGELLPLVRQRYRPGSGAVQALRTRARDLQTTIDARLQIRTAVALRDRIERGGQSRGAAVVLDAASGEVLAAASYPWPLDAASEQDEAAAAADEVPIRLLDRARYGLYPPGSTFKLLVAAAALRTEAERYTSVCTRLPDGRVGAYIPGSPRPVRDDPLDTVPHGRVDLHRGLVVSCNAYFAQLALRLGPRPLLDAASVFEIPLARTAGVDGLQATLPHAGYGQGQVLVSPLKLARISAAIAAGGLAIAPRWTADDEPATKHRFLSPSEAGTLGRAMRDVVTTGSGRSIRGTGTAIAGKTGTAEVAKAAAHSWFTGFAPYGSNGRRIAFAVIVENAGYGGRTAAPIAADIVSAATEFGLIK